MSGSGINTNDNTGYKFIPKIKDVKYKGFEPLKKKAFIKSMNEMIDNFNEYWNKTVREKLESEIEDLFDTNSNLKPLQVLLGNNGVLLKTDRIAEVIKSEKETVTPDDDDISIVLGRAAGVYCTKLTNFIDNITKNKPNDTMEVKNEELDDFSGELTRTLNSNKTKMRIKSALGSVLADQFKPVLKEGETLRIRGLEDSKRLQNLMRRLSFCVKRNENMDNAVKRKTISTIQAFRKSIAKNDPSQLKRKDVALMKEVIESVAESDPRLQTKISKEQKRFKSVKDIVKNFELLQKQATAVATNSRTSRPSNIASSVDTINENIKSIIAPPPAPKLENMPPLPTKKSATTGSNAKSTITPPPAPNSKNMPPLPTKKSAAGSKSASKIGPINSQNEMERFNEEIRNGRSLLRPKGEREIKGRSKVPPTKTENEKLTDMLREAMMKRNEEARKNGDFDEFYKQQEEEDREWAEDEKEIESKPKKQAPPVPPKGKATQNKSTTPPSGNKTNQKQSDINMREIFKKRREAMGYTDDVEEEEDDNTDWD